MHWFVKGEKHVVLNESVSKNYITINMRMVAIRRLVGQHCKQCLLITNGGRNLRWRVVDFSCYRFQKTPTSRKLEHATYNANGRKRPPPRLQFRAVFVHGLFFTEAYIPNISMSISWSESIYMRLLTLLWPSDRPSIIIAHYYPWTHTQRSCYSLRETMYYYVSCIKVDSYIHLVLPTNLQTIVYCRRS